MADDLKKNIRIAERTTDKVVQMKLAEHPNAKVRFALASNVFLYEEARSLLIESGPAKVIATLLENYDLKLFSKSVQETLDGYTNDPEYGRAIKEHLDKKYKNYREIFFKF